MRSRFWPRNGMRTSGGDDDASQVFERAPSGEQPSRVAVQDRCDGHDGLGEHVLSPCLDVRDAGPGEGEPPCEFALRQFRFQAGLFDAAAELRAVGLLSGQRSDTLSRVGSLGPSCQLKRWHETMSHVLTGLLWWVGVMIAVVLATGVLTLVTVLPVINLGRRWRRRLERAGGVEGKDVQDRVEDGCLGDAGADHGDGVGGPLFWEDLAEDAAA